jgi:poly-beta-1,6-N-acetyl-D-glucosamine synthase
MNNEAASRRILVVSPVRNEAAYVGKTIDSMVAQTLPPAAWLIVDDGSSDATPEIAARAAETHPWIHLYRRPDRGVRKVGGGVVEAFSEGLARFNLDDFDYLCKLDGDLEFGPRCLEGLVGKFEADPTLGTASGKCFDKTPSGWVQLRTSDDFSMGACKFYRVACFRQIGGFVAQVMWDGIDCHRCRMLGWKARSFHDEDLRLYEERPMGSSHKSVLHGRLRWGSGQYFMGTHPLYALAVGGYRMLERPWIIGGLLILTGYLGAWARRRPRYDDPAFRRFLHDWQLRRLRLRRQPCALTTAVNPPR